MAGLRFAPLKSDPILFDPGQAGEFADELAEVALQEQAPPWCSWIAWQDDAPMAMGGFKGPPVAGVVEIGYLTFTRNQGRGYATAMTEFLIATAHDGGIDFVIAHTLPEANASTRVLEKCGFVRDGEGCDDDVGVVWRWVRNP